MTDIVVPHEHRRAARILGLAASALLVGAVVLIYINANGPADEPEDARASGRPQAEKTPGGNPRDGHDGRLTVDGLRETLREAGQHEVADLIDKVVFCGTAVDSSTQRPVDITPIAVDTKGRVLHVDLVHASKGAFTVAVSGRRTFYLSFEAAGYVGPTYLVRPEAFDTQYDLGTLLLEPPVVVAGTATDSGGAPLSGATLVFGEIRRRTGRVSLVPFVDRGVIRKIVTDRRGGFGVDGLRAGSYSVSASGYGSVTLLVRTPKDDVNLRFTKNRGSIAGQIVRRFRPRFVYADGRPLAGASILVASSPLTSFARHQTDDDGFISFEARSGSQLDLVLPHPLSLVRGTRSVPLAPDATLTVRLPTLVTLTTEGPAEAAWRPLQFCLVPIGLEWSRVPSQYLLLQGQLGASRERIAVSSEHDYHVLILARNKQLVGHALLRKGETETTVAVPSVPALQVRVTDDKGIALADATVWALYRTDTKTSRPVADTTSALTSNNYRGMSAGGKQLVLRVAMAKCDPKGQVTLLPPPPGTTVFAEAGGCQSAPVVYDGRSDELTLPVSRGATLHGIVTPPGIHLKLANPPQALRGSFATQNPAQKRVLQSYLPGVFLIREQKLVTGDNPQRALVFGPERLFEIDSSGRFRCPGLKPGVYDVGLSYSFPGSQSRFKRVLRKGVRLGPGQVQRVSISAGDLLPGSLSFHLPRDLRQLANVYLKVLKVEPDGRSTIISRFLVTTLSRDSDGRRCLYLEAGVYRVALEGTSRSKQPVVSCSRTDCRIGPGTETSQVRFHEIRRLRLRIISKHLGHPLVLVAPRFRVVVPLTRAEGDVVETVQGLPTDLVVTGRQQVQRIMKLSPSQMSALDGEGWRQLGSALLHGVGRNDTAIEVK